MEEIISEDTSEEESNDDKVISEQFDLRERLESEISHWWKTLTLISYFTITASGIATSISIGDLIAAFENNCIFYGKLALRDIDKLAGNKTLLLDNVVVDKWGELSDCTFCEWSAASSVIFGGMLFAMFLQFGRGGITVKGGTRSWEIVMPALFINIVFFIISTIVFAKTIGGLSFFCTYILRDSRSPENFTSCGDILSFRYPWDNSVNNLYLDFIFAQIGASVMFVGWSMALVIIIFRCVLGIDFVVYRRIQYANEKLAKKSTWKKYSKSNKDKTRNSKLYDLAYQNLSETSDSDFDPSEIVETTFTQAVVEAERKKLI